VKKFKTLQIATLMSLLFFSCSHIEKKISKDNELRYLSLDNKTKEKIREYRKEYNNSIVLVTFKNKIGSKDNEYYINRVSNLSFIYDHYISYHSSVDRIPVLISSKNDGFINRDNYSSSFILELSKFLNDDMLKLEIGKDDEFIKGGYYYIDYGNLIINHAETWKVNNGKIYRNWEYHPAELKILVVNDSIDLLKYYRVVEGGIDERD